MPPLTVGSLAMIMALDALDDADAGDDAGADREVGAPRGQRAQLEERRVRVEQQLDALAGGQLAALVVPLDVLRRRRRRAPWRARRRARRAWSVIADAASVKAGERGVEGGLQRGHDWNPKRFAASPVRISVVPPPMPRMRMSRYCRSTSDSLM